MENKINFDCESLLEYEIEGKAGKIEITDLKPFIDDDFDNEDIEDMTARIYGDKILFNFTGYSGQYGVLGVWDTTKNKLIHISEGAYGLRNLLTDNTVYQLVYISGWGIQPHASLYGIKLGILDQHKESDLLVDKLEIDFNPEKDKFDLQCTDDVIYLVVNDVEHKIYDLK